MKRVVWTAGLLIALMVVLSPMAWASNTDPTWIKGWYDGGDFDDVIVYLTCGLSGIPGLPVVAPISLAVFVGTAPLLHELFPPLRPASTRSPRAPPVL